MKRWTRWAALLAAVALVAAACGGDDDGEEAETTTSLETGATTTAGDGNGGDGGGETYEDPRGGIYQEFQDSFSRDDPFTSLDEFCTSTPEPDEPPEATEPGITADAVTVVHLRSTLEDLEDIGFAVPVGNVTEMFETFVEVINEQCGGIHGRTIDLQLVEVAVVGGGGVDVDAERNAACIEATEDHEAPIILNSSGFQGSAILCIAEDHGSIFLTTQGNPGEYYERSGNKLYSISLSLDESLSTLARAVADTGALDGKTIGVVAADTPGQADAVQAGLIDVLADEYDIEVARFDVIGCAGSSLCAEGVAESVTGMKSDGVDVLFPTLNVVSLPGYINEMVTQGFQTGAVEIYNSGFNSQAGDLVSSKVVEFGGDQAGALYDGTVIYDSDETGAFRLEGFEASPFDEMCNRVYSENNESGDSFQQDVEEQSSPYGMVSTVCAEVRAMARALFAAGPNPTRESIAEAMENLGPFDVGGMDPASFRPGKYSAPDALYPLEFNFPCDVQPAIKSCILPTGDAVPIERD